MVGPLLKSVSARYDPQSGYVIRVEWCRGYIETLLTEKDSDLLPRLVQAAREITETALVLHRRINDRMRANYVEPPPGVVSDALEMIAGERGGGTRR